MQQFPVEDDVVVVVWQRANPKPFESLTFSAALRRVLGIGEAGTSAAGARGASHSSASAASAADNPPDDLDAPLVGATAVRPRAKAPKANLKELVRAGLLRDGQELVLVDYQSNKHQQFKARIAGGMLHFKGQHYSMSDLARDLLKKIGYQSDSVRGPTHWATVSGASVRDLWQQLREKRPAK